MIKVEFRDIYDASDYTPSEARKKMMKIEPEIMKLVESLYNRSEIKTGIILNETSGQGLITEFSVDSFAEDGDRHVLDFTAKTRNNMEACGQIIVTDTSFRARAVSEFHQV